MTDLSAKRQAQLAKGKPAEQRRRGVTPSKEPKAVSDTTGVKAPPEKRYEPLPELKENCGSCGNPLRYIPVNSRVKAVACTKIGCALYRERLKLVTLKEVKQGAEGNNINRKD